MSFTKSETFFGWATCAVLFLSPFVVNRGLVDYANLPQTVFIETAALILLVSACANIAVRGHVRMTGNPSTYAVILFLLWVLISLVWARNRYEALLVCLCLMSCGIIFFMISHFIDGAEWSKRLLWAIVMAGTGVALLGCAQHVFNISWIPQQEPPAATFGNRNVASEVVSMILPILPVVMFLPSTKRTVFVTRMVTFLIGMILFAYLFFTETRAAWLASIISISVVTISLIRDALLKDSLVRVYKRSVLRIVLSSTGLLIALTIFTPKTLRDFVDISRQKCVNCIKRRASIDIRLKMWENGIEMFKDRPVLGRGIGNFKVFYPLYHGRAAIDPAFSEQKRPLNIHNDLLQAGIELGAVGFLLFAGLFVLSLFMAHRLSRRHQPPKVRLIAIGVGGGVLAMLVTSMFSFPMERAIPPLILFAYMGILVACHNRQRAGQRDLCLRVPRKVAIPVCVLSFAVALMITRFNYDVLISDWHYRASLKMARIGAWPEVIRSGLKSYEINPHKTTALEAVGWAYVESNQLHEGIESLRKVLQSYPYNIKAMRKLGDAYYKAGDYQKAFEVFEELIEIEPNSPGVLACMGNICMKNENYTDALTYFEEAATYDPENVLLHTNLGFVKFKLGRYSEAAKEYEKVLTYSPDMLYAHKSLASIYNSYMKEPDKASYHMQRCIEIGGEDCRPERFGGEVDIGKPKPVQEDGK